MNAPEPHDCYGWYNQDGTLAKEINGKAPTLREARKYNLVPRVSEVLDIASPTSAMFAGTRAAELGARRYNSEHFELDSPEAQAVYRSCGWSACNDGNAATDYGTKCHGQLEAAAKRYASCNTEGVDTSQWQVAGNEEPSVRLVIYWLEENAGRPVAWEQTIVHPLGFAGTIDLIHKPSPKRQGIIDYKSQAYKAGKKPKIHKRWLAQMGAYSLLHRHHYGFPPSTLQNLVFSSADNAADVHAHKWNRTEAERFFLQHLKLWKTYKNYDPTQN